jgi:hypothetical protein
MISLFGVVGFIDQVLSTGANKTLNNYVNVLSGPPSNIAAVTSNDMKCFVI